MPILETEPFASPGEINDVPPVFLANSREGREIIDQIEQARNPVDNIQPEEDITHSPDEAIRDYMARKFFMATDRLKRGGPVALVNSNDAEHPIKVPTRLLIDAQSFASWNGRLTGHNKTISTPEGHQTLSSFDVIKRYATMETPPPPVKQMDMFIQPNGTVFFSSGDAHRAAAAVMRGSVEVDTYSVRIWSLPEDIL